MEPEPDPEHRPRRWSRWSGRAGELVVLPLLLLVPVVHPPARMLAPPYWVDEAWVAVGARAPLADLPWVTATTPAGWTLLVRLVSGAGQQARWLPWAGLLASVLAGYALGRLVGAGAGPARPAGAGRWAARLVGLAAGLAVLLLPAQRARHDLKQYTTDAAVTLALLVLLGRLERARAAGTGRAGLTRRAAGLGLALVAAMLISHVAAFAGAAVLLAVGLRALRYRFPWPAAGALAGVAVPGLVVLYLLLDRPRTGASLATYWAGYLPGPAELPTYLVRRLAELDPALGVPWPVLLALAGTGIVVLARRGAPTTALAAGLLPAFAVLAGVAGRYPLLDQRTSHYLLVTGAALAGIGLAGLAGTLATRIAPGRPARAGLLAAGLLAPLLTGYALRAATIPAPPPGGGREDIRTQVRYVAAHHVDGDTILVNMSGQYGFGWYWPDPAPRFVRGGTEATGWYLTYPAGTRVVLATGRDPDAVAAALARARAVATGPGGDGRVWLIRSHVAPAEAAAWDAALAGWNRTDLQVGVEPLAVLTAARTAPG